MRRPLLAALACAITLQRTRDGCRHGSRRRPQARHDHVLERLLGPASSQRLQSAFDAFHAKYPWITVKGTGNINDDKILAAISSGTPPDALLSFSPNNAGKFCSTGAWQNLNDRIKKAKLDLAHVPEGRALVLGLQGQPVLAAGARRLLRPLLQHGDVQGEGDHAAAQTLSELTADAKKLTVRNADGSLKVAGFVPLGKYYEDSFADGLRAGLRRALVRLVGQAAALAGSALDGAAEVAEVADRLVRLRQAARFTAASADEFSASNDFERGRVAMLYDGEWRTAFLKAEQVEGRLRRPRRSRRPTAQPGSSARAHRRQHRRDPEGLEAPRRGLAADQVPRDATPTHRRPLEPAAGTCRRRRPRNRSPKIKHDPNFAPFLKIFTNPRVDVQPADADRPAVPATRSRCS